MNVSDRNFARLTQESEHFPGWTRLALDSNVVGLVDYLGTTGTIDRTASRRFDRVTAYLDALILRIEDQNRATLKHARNQ